MNIFALSTNPTNAAMMMCDKHVPKMIVESAQMMASALRRHEESVLRINDAESIDDLFTEMKIVTKKGTPYKGGYAHHPCTVWAGDTWANFMWLADHATALLYEFTARFGEGSVRHACWTPINRMTRLGAWMNNQYPESQKTAFAMAMPDEYKQKGKEVIAYRDYYFAEKAQFAKWERGREAPTWWIAKRRAQIIEEMRQ